MVTFSNFSRSIQGGVSVGLISNFINKGYDAFGLDIGQSSIKLVELKKRGSKIYLHSYNSVPTPPDVFLENNIKNTDALSALIREALKTAKINPVSSHFVVLGLPEFLTFTKIIKVPKMSAKELGQAVKWEANQAIPVSIEETYFDWQILTKDETATQLDIILVAAPRVLVDSYVAAAQNVGLEPVAIEIEPLAVSRAVIRAEEKNPQLILDMGSKTTSLTVFDKGSIQFTASALVGGKQINVALAQKFGKTPEQIEEELKDHNKNKDLLKAGFEILKPTLDNIITEAKRTIRFYEDASSRTISKVLICGGEAALPGVPVYMERAIGVTVKIGNPWINLPTYPLKPIPHEELPSYTTAIGLSMQELEGKTLK